jgi:hypothetical protein
MPVHSVGVIDSPSTSIDVTSASTGTAKMLSDAVPAGSTPSTALHSTKPSPVDSTPA